MGVAERMEQGVVNKTHINSKQLKIRCYLVCLLALLLTLSPAYICQTGLSILLVFPPLAAAHWLRSGKTSVTKGHLLWLLLALGWSAGVMACGNGLACAVCFCISLLCWAIYLCYCAQQGSTQSKIVVIAFQAVFYNPWAFFEPDPSIRQDKRRRRLARLTYVVYVFVVLLVLLVLLLIQADRHIDEVLRVVIGFALERAPLIMSCLVLALFPAALIYSFLFELKTMSSLSFDSAQAPSVRKGVLETLPWPKLCGMFTVINCVFMLLEIYFYVIQRESLPLRTDGLYDVLAVILIIFIGFAAICYQITLPRRTPSKSSIMLGISLFGLIIVASVRLFPYIMYYGLWNERALFSVILLILALTLMCLTFFSGRTSRWFFRSMTAALSVFLTVLIAIPNGVVLTQVNAAIFLYKYNTQKLDGQSNAETGLPLELTDHDLRLDLMEGYGINGIPALLSLVEIDQVTVDGETLGRHVQDAVLDYLCYDLDLMRTEDNQKDVNAVIYAADHSPRYRLYISYVWALELLKKAKDTF